ncbi:hypothetical protein UlMin_010554 [Ulmus minor]
MAGGGTTLEYTPTWVVALVSTIIVFISLSVERIIHYIGKFLTKKNQKPLFEALQKIKEELMLLGFISLLLTVSQDRIAKICITKNQTDKWLPCKKKDEASTTEHFRLLAEAATADEYCTEKGKVPMLSITALHHLHIFIFVLAVVHVTMCVLTIVISGLKIRQWKHWEDSIAQKDYNPDEVLKNKVTNVRDHAFIKGHFLGMEYSAFRGWVHSFFKQFYGSVTKTDYITMRLGFIMTHSRSNPKFNFYKYMIRALEADFKKVVGISWYLWLYVVVFLCLNVSGWHIYFWLSFLPFILLLAVGTKLEHVILQLAHDVAEKHVAIEGDLVIRPSDDHFWFHRPRLVLLLIHIIQFQNSFELAFFFWIWVQYKFDSCMMGEIGFIIPRLVIGVFVQFLCSYGTLPLYAIVTQMGSSFKKAIFEEYIQVGLVGWAQKAKKNKGLNLKRASNGSSTQVGPKEDSPSVQLVSLSHAGENPAGEIEPAIVSNGRASQ